MSNVRIDFLNSELGLGPYSEFFFDKNTPLSMSSSF